ncbi:MAG: enoyl-CoA hydratase/isomerase family protein [Actinomycetota bacterium]|nr:enoyl-CoA hydratase/isomerase family protein [Actinomycetota bacterium]
MAKRSNFEEYRDKYPRFKLEKTEEKILLFQLHTDGGEFAWDWRAHGDFGDACADIAGDRDINVVIFTGTGDGFMNIWNPPTDKEFPAHQDAGAEQLDESGWRGRQRHLNFLDIQVPVIAAINGPCCIHAELPVMCDIVLAAEHAWLQDSTHFPRGVVPGDGVQTVWPMVLGRNRARYFLLMGQKLSAQELLECGAVNEVLPKEQLMDRAWEVARYLAMRPPLTLRLTRSVLVQEFKRAALNDLALGQFQELYAMRNYFSYRGGQEPLDRPWDQDPWT